jgi:hypothetical protein
LELIYRYGHASGQSQAGDHFVFESRRIYGVKCDLREEVSSQPGEKQGFFPVELIVMSETNTPV